MKRKNRLSVALDIDDVLMECTTYAIKLANEKYKFDPPLSVYERKQWGKQGDRSDAIFEFFGFANINHRVGPVTHDIHTGCHGQAVRFLFQLFVGHKSSKKDRLNALH